MGVTFMSDPAEAAAQPERRAAISVFRANRAPQRVMPATDLILGREIFAEAYPLALFNAARVWDSLTAVDLQAAKLRQAGLFTQGEQSPAGPAFDVLRTSVAQAMAEREWRRIGITSPSHGCGKSFIAANLALSLARRPGSRTVLLDLDLRRPNLHALLGLEPLGAMRDFLDGTQPLEGLFVRVGQSLALGLNAEATKDAGDLLHSADTAQALDAMEMQLDPQVTVIDLPPALMGDDVLAMRGKVDAVLLVADGTQTTAKEIRACEALFENRIPVMGIVLNRAQDASLAPRKRNKG